MSDFRVRYIYPYSIRLNISLMTKLNGILTRLEKKPEHTWSPNVEGFSFQSKCVLGAFDIYKNLGKYQ